MRHIAFTVAALWMASCAVVMPRAAAADPLHERIDALIHGGSIDNVELTTDLEFLRRATLDLAGRIPTRDEIRRFEQSAAAGPAKRAELVGRLLGSNAFTIHFAEKLDVMLMERRGSDDHWIEFLRAAVAEQMGWDQLVRHLVDPDAEDPRHRGSAGFIVKRLERYGQNPSDMPGLVRDVGRMFLGMDIQCAQCHDHLFVDDYLQVDYQGLFAFLGQAELRRDTPFPAVSQKLMTAKVEFASVFDGEQQTVGPKLPGGEEIAIPTFAKGEEYLIAPDRKTRFPGVPKFQPLEALAEQLTADGNEAFARNFANRMWWMVMGRGLVDPLDLHHPDNPPSHPELLELLAEEAVAHKYDIRWMLGELCKTRTYQLSSRSDRPRDDLAWQAKRYRIALERPLSAEQLCRSVSVAAPPSNSLLPPCESLAEPETPLDADRLERFRKAFANPPKDPEIAYRPSVKAALFLRNDAPLQQWLAPEGPVVAGLAKLSDPGQIAVESYLRFVCRRPTKDEVADVTEFLKQYDDREKAEGVSDLAWALLTSAEFLLNH